MGIDGDTLGLVDGEIDGDPLGLVDGLALGLTHGQPDGLADGLALGAAEGDVVGDEDGLPLGDTVGDALGEQTGQSRKIDTPFGAPSSPILLTQWHGVDIAILKRHGPGHTYNPSKVPYRANVYALKSLGVTHIVASGATGSLREHIHPGHLVLVDQLIDKTFKRSNTFYEHAAIHVETVSYTHLTLPTNREV